MSKCENCECDHEGVYGSGRFCSAKCSRSYSTKTKRSEINAKVSATLAGRKIGGKSFEKGFDPRRKAFTNDERMKGTKIRLENIANSYLMLDWLDLPEAEQRRRILNEQKNVCNQCGLNTWFGNSLTLELHHKNGDNQDQSRNNLEILCPNCHSLTWNYRGKLGMAQ